MELLVVAVLGAVIVMAMYEVLATNQRTYSVQNASTQVQRTLRAGASVLYSELREVSPAEGDIVEMSEQEVEVRAMKEFGYVCGIPASSQSNAVLLSDAVLRVREVGRALQQGDSAVVFKDNDPQRTGDDRWGLGVISSRDMVGSTCMEDGQNIEVPDVTLQDVAYGAPPDSILLGAPVRAFVHRTYRLEQIDGERFLVRSEDGGDVEPLLGPLDSDEGLRFVYLDEDETETTEPDEVRQIVVTLRRTTGARRPDGGYVGDSLTLRIFPRN